MFETLHDETEGVPFNISFILFGVVGKENAVLVDLYENRTDFEDYCLESDYFSQRFNRANRLEISFSRVGPDKWLQGVEMFILPLNYTLIDSSHLLTRTVIRQFTKSRGLILLQSGIPRRGQFLLIQHLNGLF